MDSAHTYTVDLDVTSLQRDYLLTLGAAASSAGLNVLTLELPYLVRLLEALLISFSSLLPFDRQKGIELAKLGLWVGVPHFYTLLITKELHAPQLVRPTISPAGGP